MAKYILLLLGLCALFFMPVTQTVLAPALITAKNPFPITAPDNGMITRIYVQPNEAVQTGEALFQLDTLELQHRAQVTDNALILAKEKYRKASQHAFQSETSKASLAILKARIDTVLQEKKFIAEQLARHTVRAPEAGIVAFSDPNAWIGRPVKIGEKVMLLTKTHLKELTVTLPTSQAIALKKGSLIKFYPNTQPLRPLYATLIYISYSAEPIETGQLAYHVKGQLHPVSPQYTSVQPNIRIGVRGTAKLYGHRVSLGYFLAWKPLSLIRQQFGL